MNYSPELKESILRRLLPPNSESVTKVAKEEGLPAQTLRTWLSKARKEGHPAPGRDTTTDEGSDHVGCSIRPWHYAFQQPS